MKWIGWGLAAVESAIVVGMIAYAVSRMTEENFVPRAIATYSDAETWRAIGRDVTQHPWIVGGVAAFFLIHLAVLAWLIYRRFKTTRHQPGFTVGSNP